MKKRYFALFLAAVMCLFALSACGNTATEEQPAAEAEKTVYYEILSEDSFEGAGFTYWVCEKDGTYTVNADNGEPNVGWRIYVLDGEFEDGLRYIVQAYEPVLEGSGTLELKAGQYVYIQCGANSFSYEEPVPGGKLTIE